MTVAMYDDHLEITNPGTLYFGFTPDKLTQPHASKPWNPIIAEVFYRAGHKASLTTYKNNSIVHSTEISSEQWERLEKLALPARIHKRPEPNETAFR